MTSEVEKLLEELGSSDAPAPSARFADTLESDLRVLVATSSASAPGTRFGRWPATVAAVGFTLSVVVFALATLTRGPEQVHISTAENAEVILPSGERFAAGPGIALPSGAVVLVGEEGSVTIGDEVFGPNANIFVEGDDLAEVDDIAAIVTEFPTSTIVVPDLDVASSAPPEQPPSSIEDQPAAISSSTTAVDSAVSPATTGDASRVSSTTRPRTTAPADGPGVSTTTTVAPAVSTTLARSTTTYVAVSTTVVPTTGPATTQTTSTTPSSSTSTTERVDPSSTSSTSTTSSSTTDPTSTTTEPTSSSSTSTSSTSSTSTVPADGSDPTAVSSDDWPDVEGAIGDALEIVRNAQCRRLINEDVECGAIPARAPLP